MTKTPHFTRLERRLSHVAGVGRGLGTPTGVVRLKSRSSEASSR